MVVALRPLAYFFSPVRKRSAELAEVPPFLVDQRRR